MKTHDNTRSQVRQPGTANWLPPHPARSINPTCWLSRAARGHTWNGEAAFRRRHTH